MAIERHSAESLAGASGKWKSRRAASWVTAGKTTYIHQSRPMSQIFFDSGERTQGLLCTGFPILQSPISIHFRIS
jgi:hypothetical protein